MSEGQEQSIATIWQDRFIKREYLPAGELARRFNVLNPRSHPEAQTDAIESSLDTVGWFDEISLSTNGDGPASLVDNPDARMFDGHDRVELVLMRGGESALVPVKWYQLSREETDFALLVKDQTTGMAELIPDKLATLMERTRAMTANKPALSGMLDKLRERAGVVNGGNGGGGDDLPIPIDRAEELQKVWQVKPGDIWQLGEHRLICGDCREPETWARLLEGRKVNRVDMCFTSPPYNIGVSAQLSGNTNIDDSFYKNDNDSKSLEDYRQFLNDWTKVALSFCQFVFCNIQPLAGNKRPLVGWWFDNVLNFADVIVWDKGHAAPQQAQRVLNSRFEFIIVFSHGTTRSIGTKDFRGTVDNVFNGNPQRNNDYASVHAATMPINLPLWILENFTNINDVVTDPFMGTGTTLVACEYLRRRCLGIEVDPLYIAVTLERFFDLTRIEPKLISG